MANKKKVPGERGLGGRPRLEIDMEQLEKLARMFCTQEEIAGFFNVSIDTVERRVQEEYQLSFAEYIKRASSVGKTSIRHAQYIQAVHKRSVPMLIWFGKQYLGQKDGPDAGGWQDRPPINININGTVDKKDLDPEQNDNLEINRGHESN